jgi:hypothetical protein
MAPLLAALLPSAIQGVAGLFQSATSGAGAAERNLEKFAKQNPLAKRSKSLDDYYQRSLNEVNQNPYQTSQYLISKQEADRRLAAGIGAMQGRGGALNAISKLDLMRTDSQNQAIRNAEAFRGQNLNRLGQATQMQIGQDRYLYDVNKATPFNTMLGIKQLKSAAANERYNSGINMIGSAAGNYAMGQMYAGANAVKPTSAIGPSSQDTFNSWMGDKSLMPQANSNYFPKNGLTPIAERFGYGSGNLYGYRPAGGNSALNSIFTPNTFINDMSNWNKARSLGG